MKDYHTRAPPLSSPAEPCRAVLCRARGRSDLGSNIPSKRLHILPGVMTVMMTVHLTCTSAKELWDALDEKFGVSDASSVLYIMEQLFDYKMVENRPIVEQAHEI
jgi:hypothetical protein